MHADVDNIEAIILQKIGNFFRNKFLCIEKKMGRNFIVFWGIGFVPPSKKIALIHNRTSRYIP